MSKRGHSGNREGNGKEASASAAAAAPTDANQTISALLDDQADDLALPRLLRAAASDEELPRRWARYHLVHSLLRGCQVLARPTLARRVAAAVATLPLPSAQTQTAQQAQQAQQAYQLQQETQGSQAPAPRWPAWQANTGRVAIAASVAAAVFFSLQAALQPPSLQPSEEMLLASDSNAGYNAGNTRIASTRGTDADEVASNVRIYLQRIYGDAEVEPVHIEHLEDSPLYRLVNDLRAQAEQNSQLP